MKNQVQLITYADRLGGTLHGLSELLKGPLAGLFGGVHLLPFFHPIDGADAGFDPIDHTEVDQRLGSWEDVRAIARDVDVMADVIVNHISSHSPQFLDYSASGKRSSYDGLFLTFDGVFPNGASEQDLLAIYRPRPGLPFTPMTLADGTKRILWTTFTSEQIDIDVHHPEGIRYLENILQILAANGVRMVRLDAVGYAVKKAGRSSFMMEETFDFIRSFSRAPTARARSAGRNPLPLRAADRDRAPRAVGLRLRAAAAGAARPFQRHGRARSSTGSRFARATASRCSTLTMASGSSTSAPTRRIVRQKPGLVPEEELSRLVQQIHANSKGESLRATGAAASNLDLYQVNCTFYDALGGDDLKYLLGRAIQFFLPGVPQVYYVGLLAGHNDMQLLTRTHVGRDINRHYYTRGEVDQAVRKPLVARSLRPHSPAEYPPCVRRHVRARSLAGAHPRPQMAERLGLRAPLPGPALVRLPAGNYAKRAGRAAGFPFPPMTVANAIVIVGTHSGAR